MTKNEADKVYSDFQHSDAWSLGDWQYQTECAALNYQAEENYSCALYLAADDIGSGKNEAGVPEKWRAEVAEYLRLRAKAERGRES